MNRRQLKNMILEGFEDLKAKVDAHKEEGGSKPAPKSRGKRKRYRPDRSVKDTNAYDLMFSHTKGGFSTSTRIPANNPDIRAYLKKSRITTAGRRQKVDDRFMNGLRALLRELHAKAQTPAVKAKIVVAGKALNDFHREALKRHGGNRMQANVTLVNQGRHR